MTFQFAFACDGIQDAKAFFVAFEHHAISIGCRDLRARLREELFRLQMSSTMEYTDYEREFIDLWTTWIRLRVKRSMNVLR